MAQSYVKRFRELIRMASDAEAVKKSIGARLYANASMSGSTDLPTSSKDAEIDAIIQEFEGDADMSSKISSKLRLGGKRTRKLKRKSRQPRKTRKYSRRQ